MTCAGINLDIEDWCSWFFFVGSIAKQRQTTPKVCASHTTCRWTVLTRPTFLRVGFRRLHLNHGQHSIVVSFRHGYSISCRRFISFGSIRGTFGGTVARPPYPRARPSPLSRHNLLPHRPSPVLGMSSVSKMCGGVTGDGRADSEGHAETDSGTGRYPYVLSVWAWRVRARLPGVRHQVTILHLVGLCVGSQPPVYLMRGQKTDACT